MFKFKCNNISIAVSKAIEIYTFDTNLRTKNYYFLFVKLC